VLVEARQPQLRVDLTSVYEALPQELWEPFDQAVNLRSAGTSLIEAVNSLRPLASEALLALFKQRMTSQLEDAFGKVLEHQAKRK